MSKKQDFIDSIKNLNLKELNERLQEDKLRLKKLKFAHAVSPLGNPRSIKVLRRDIARIVTLIKQKSTAEKSES